MHDRAPSAWVRRWTPAIAPDGSVLDVACGSGRHVRWLLAAGFTVVGVDRDARALEELRASCPRGRVEVVEADLEHGAWPFQGRRFDGVVMTDYLWRPRFRAVVESVAHGGVLIVETFAVGQERLGRPRNPDFLLQPRELLDLVGGELEVAAYEAGTRAGDPPAIVQRIVAARGRRLSLPDPVPGSRGKV